MITKTELDKLVKEYETIEFIQQDPIQIPHRYIDEKEIELVGFISALFAYGSRKIFIPKLDFLFSQMGNSPVEYLKKGDFTNLQGFNYRFGRWDDINNILRILSLLYQNGSTIRKLFGYGYKTTGTIYGMLQVVSDYFYSNCDDSVGDGFYFMVANPQKGGAMKRMNMYLRWMVRSSPVDFGIWHFISSSELLIPLDTHVAKISREMGLLDRNDNGRKSVEELTEKLKEFDKNDPVKYDFAIYGKGIS